MNSFKDMESEDKIYLTKEGLEKFQKEFERLKKLKELKTKGETPVAFPSQGIDAEYTTFQEDLNLLESRLEELETILKKRTLIAPPPRKQRRIVSLGATVIVEVEGQRDEFTIVGSLEADPMLGKISNESPVGKALLGHRAGDEIKVQSAVTTIYKIKKITYKI